MKKFSKVLTGVLSALLLTLGGVNFTSCSNDDGDTPKNPSLTIAAEASEGQVTAGGVITTTITATLKDTTFKGPIAKDASLNEYVDITYSGDTDFVGNPTLTAVEEIANGATVAKVKLVQTAAAVTEEKSGTISVKIKASALASGKDLTAGNKLPYKISAAAPTPAKATAKTYSFAGGTNGITLADLDGWDMASKDVIGSPVAATLTSKTLANGAILHWKGSKVGTLRFRSTHDASAALTEAIANAVTTLNYNGGLASGDLSAGCTLADVDRYIEVVVDGAGTVKATATFKGGKDTDNITGGPFKAAFVDKDGKLVGSVAEGAVVGNTDVQITGTVSEACSVYLVFSRNGAVKGSSGTGGIDVTSIAVTPAE